MKRGLGMAAAALMSIAACGSNTAAPGADGGAPPAGGDADLGVDLPSSLDVIDPNVTVISVLERVRVNSRSELGNFQSVTGAVDFADGPYADVRLVLELDSSCFPFERWKDDPPPPGQSWPAQCDAFDRLLEVTLDPPAPPETRPPLELLRAVTPFGGPMRYEADITDVANGLPGAHNLGARVDTWPDPMGRVSGSSGGWFVTMKVVLKKGPAPRDVLAIVPLFHDFQKTAESAPHTFDLPAGTARTRIEYRATGHTAETGPMGPDCIGPPEEFCRRTHTFAIDDNPAGSFSAWRPTCTDLCTLVTLPGPNGRPINYCQENPCGSIPSVRAPRATWCPGSATPPRIIEATDLAAGPQSQQVHKTRSGILMGTPLYMSPEQCRDSGRIDYRTDIYSLGCVLFEMLTGRPPFVREGLGELIVAHLTEAPPEVHTLAPGVPPALAELTAQLLRKDPTQRPENMKVVATRLMSFVAGVTTVPEALPPPAAVAAATVPPRMASVRPVASVPSTGTTFEHSASEVVPAYDDDEPARKRRAPLVIGVVLTLAAVGAGAAIFQFGGTTPATSAATAGLAAAGSRSESSPLSPALAAAVSGTPSHAAARPAAKEDGAAKKHAGAASKKTAVAVRRPEMPAAAAETQSEPRRSTVAEKSPGGSATPTTPPALTGATSPPPAATIPSVASSTPASNTPASSAPASNTPKPVAVAAATATPPAAAAAAHPPAAGDLSGAWEGPWEDHGKQQKGRLFLQIGSAGAVSGWMYNRAAKGSFRLVGTMSPRGDVDLTCQCPPQQGFVARGSIRRNGSTELTGQLSLSAGAGVFGQSHLTLRRTNQTR